MTGSKLTDSLARTLFELVGRGQEIRPGVCWNECDRFRRKRDRDNCYDLAGMGLLRFSFLVNGETHYETLPAAKVAYDAWYAAGGWRRISGGVWTSRKRAKE